MIDLHTHSDESDGSLSPSELVAQAVRIGLEALAITDHDTLAGYDLAIPYAAGLGIDLICGIELSATYAGHSVHVLGYFPKGGPGDQFRQWVSTLEESRSHRNQLLLKKLQTSGIGITLGGPPLY